VLARARAAGDRIVEQPGLRAACATRSLRETIATSSTHAPLRFFSSCGPTTERREGERLIEHYATFVSGYETSAYGIEWMRFEPEAPVPELVRTVPHVAFEVDDLSAEI